MPKDREIIYSQQKTDFAKGRAYANPRFFSTPRQDVSKVLIVGDWPNIRAAYEALNVPVENVDALAVLSTESPKFGGVRSPPELTPGADEASRNLVMIPPGWRDLRYIPRSAEELSLRQLGAMVSPTTVTNKKAAIEAIEAELVRRQDIPNPAAGGLTIRELRAALEARGIEPDPDLDAPDLLTARDAKRG